MNGWHVDMNEQQQMTRDVCRQTFDGEDGSHSVGQFGCHFLVVRHPLGFHSFQDMMTTTTKEPLPSGHSSLSAFSAADAAIVAEKLKTLHSQLKNVQDEREKSEATLKSIGKTHDKMQSEPSKPYFKHKLKTL